MTSIHYGRKFGILAGLIPFGVGLFHYGQFIHWTYFHGPYRASSESPQILNHEPYIFFLASMALMGMGLGLGLAFFLDRMGDSPPPRGLVVFLLFWVGTHDLLVEFITNSFPKPLLPISLGMIALWMTRKSAYPRQREEKIVPGFFLWIVTCLGGTYLIFDGLWRLWNILPAFLRFFDPGGIPDLPNYPVMGHIAGANFMGVGAILCSFSHRGIYKQDPRFLRAFLMITGWVLFNDLVIFYFYNVFPLNPVPFLLSGMAGLYCLKR